MRTTSGYGFCVRSIQYSRTANLRAAGAAPLLALFEKACPVLPKPRAKPRGIAEGPPPELPTPNTAVPRASCPLLHHIFLVRQSQTRNRNGARILRECSIEKYVRLQRRTHHPPQNHLRRLFEKWATNGQIKP